MVLQKYQIDVMDVVTSVCYTFLQIIINVDKLILILQFSNHRSPYIL